MAATVRPEDIVAALTWARTRPKEVAAAVRERLKYYKGKEYSPPERGGSSIMTKEGKTVVEEAISYLEALEPMQGVGTASDVGLGLAAEDHTADIGYTGVVSHSSSDGTAAHERVARYGSFKNTGESLWYGSKKADARTMVLDLIVDDGVASRGHRLCVCNPIWDCVGVSYGPHATFGAMATLEFAKDWRTCEAKIEARLASGPVKIEGQEEAKKSVSTQWKLGACMVCRQEIRGGAVMEIEKLGGKVHKDCFTCKECDKSLCGVPWNAHERSIYCKSCFDARFGEKCTACGKIIEGGMMKCALGKFHVDCVVCVTCNKQVGKGPFSTSSGAIVCQTCSSQSTRSASVGRVAGLTAGSPAPTNSLNAKGFGAAPKATPKSGAVAKAGAAAKAPTAAAPKAASKAKAKAKATAATVGSKVSLAGAGAAIMGLGMDYGSL